MLMLVLIALAGCSSGAVLGTVYDRFGSQTAKRFKSYTHFSPAQKKQIEDYSASYHSWHRSSQLPKLAQLLSDISTDIASHDKIDVDISQDWMIRVKALSGAMRECNPLNESGELLANLDDDQSLRLLDNMRRDLDERVQEYRAEDRQEKIDRRVKTVIKWGGRGGVSFNDAQRELLRKTLSNQISLGAQRYGLRELWINEFEQLMTRRNQSDFVVRINEHINSIWLLTESNFPQQWRTNEELWAGFFSEYINLQTDAQRKVFLKKLQSVKETFGKLSVKAVDASPVCYQP